MVGGGQCSRVSHGPCDVGWVRVACVAPRAKLLVELGESARFDKLVKKSLVLGCRAIAQVDTLRTAQCLGALDKIEYL